MARVEHTPIPLDDKAAALEAFVAYKAQNPTKAAKKKDAYFKKYGLDMEADTSPVEDELDKELKAVKKRVTKTKK